MKEIIYSTLPGRKQLSINYRYLLLGCFTDMKIALYSLGHFIVTGVLGFNHGGLPSS